MAYFFNRDGSVYNGKVEGFLASVVSYLQKIASCMEGCTMLTELESSNNVFTIKETQGESKFIASHELRSDAVEFKFDPSIEFSEEDIAFQLENLKGGSGGTIHLSKFAVQLPTVDGFDTNPVAILAHELFHGLDANSGVMREELYEGLALKEWQASYRENILRGQLGMPLRTHYIAAKGPMGRFGGGLPPKILSPENKQPILPPGYKP